jgi:hypothetical protein
MFRFEVILPDAFDSEHTSYISVYVDGGAAVPSGWKNKIFVIWILSVAWAAFFLEINTLH